VLPALLGTALYLQACAFAVPERAQELKSCDPPSASNCASRSAVNPVRSF